MNLLISLFLLFATVHADDHAVEVTATEAAPVVDTVTVTKDVMRPLRVGVVGGPPFVIEENGQFDGLSVAYWRQVADSMGLEYELSRTNMTFDASVKAVSEGKYDVLIGPISVTYDRSQIVDFSRPYFVNNVGLVVLSQPLGFFDVMMSMFGDAAMHLLIGFLVLLVIFTHLFYFSERRYAERYQGGYVKGMSDACWTTVSSFLRDVLYDPVSGVGRFILSIWLVLSVVFMAAFTAVVTSTMTYTMSQGYVEIASKHDLEGKRVAVKRETSMVGYARDFGAITVSYDSTEEAFKLLREGKVKAILGNYYSMKKDVADLQGEHSFIMSDLNLRNDEFAIVVPRGSDLLRKIDRSILHLQDNQKTVDDICARYLGPKHTHSCEF